MAIFQRMLCIIIINGRYCIISGLIAEIDKEILEMQNDISQSENLQQKENLIKNIQTNRKKISYLIYKSM